MDDTWEKDYERDRQRALRGENIDEPRRRRSEADDDDEYEKYYGKMAYSEPATPADPIRSSTDAAAAAPAAPCATPPGAVASTSLHVDERGGPASGAPVASEPTVTETVPPKFEHETKETAVSFAGDVDITRYPPGTVTAGDVDPRYGMPLVALPDGMPTFLRTKFGAIVFFAAPTRTYFAGALFGQNKERTWIVCTARAVYFGCASTGRIWICRGVFEIESMNRFGQLFFSIRAAKHPAEMGVQTSTSAEKPIPADVLFSFDEPEVADRFSCVVRRLHQASSQAVQKASASSTAKDDDYPKYGTGYQDDEQSGLRYIEASEDRRDAFKGGMDFMKPSQWRWDLLEDPRSGVGLLRALPPNYDSAFAPLRQKLLHWMGPVSNVTKDRAVEKRVAWITPTCVFLCDSRGVAPDGRGIRRCIGLEHVSVVVSEGNELGIAVMSGPKQGGMLLRFEAAQTAKFVLYVLQRCYTARAMRPLTVHSGAGAVQKDLGALALMPANDKFRPEVFVMRTKQELYALLRRDEKGKD